MLPLKRYTLDDSGDDHPMPLPIPVVIYDGHKVISTIEKELFFPRRASCGGCRLHHAQGKDWFFALLMLVRALLGDPRHVDRGGVSPARTYLTGLTSSAMYSKKSCCSLTVGIF